MIPRVVVDVQHAFRGGRHANDRGAVFVRSNGLKVSEVDLALEYAKAIADELRSRGRAEVLVNNPSTGLFCGPYQRRQESANRMGAAAYLACHVNAGRGSYARIGFTAARSIGLANEIRGSIEDWFGDTLSSVQVKPIAQTDRGSVCVRFATCPAVLLEPFFGDNPLHLADLGSAMGLRDLGHLVGAGVLRWWEALPVRLTPAAPVA